jgi:hypothetical protein
VQESIPGKKIQGPDFFSHGLKIIFSGKNKTSSVKNKLSRGLKINSGHDKIFPGCKNKIRALKILPGTQKDNCSVLEKIMPFMIE